MSSLSEVTCFLLLWKSFQSALGVGQCKDDTEGSEVKMGMWILYISLHLMTGRSLQVKKRRRKMKASRLSVDIRQVFVVPIEVAPGVEPVLGAGVRVGARLEPSSGPLLLIPRSLLSGSSLFLL